MKKSIFPCIICFCLCVYLQTGCKSSPPPDDVWSLLARGDSRAMDYFRGEVDVNSQDPSGRTPLHYAAEQKDPQMAAFFISLGAKIDALDSENRTPLGICAENNCAEVAKVLVSVGADIHLQSGGVTPARAALTSGGDFLLSIINASTIISTDSRGRTIVHLASIDGNNSALRTIFGALSPAEITSALRKKDNDGKSALDLAFDRKDSQDHFEIAEQLILAGATSEYADYPVYYYFAPAVQSANYNIRRGDGLSAMHFAARESIPGLVSFLIMRKADVNSKNSAGAVPLHEAARSGNLQIMEMLLANGAEVNAEDAKSNTPLHISIPADIHSEALRLLLARGANPNLRDEHGDSPLHVVIMLNRGTDVVQTLLGSGADVNLRNIEGKTPLYVAIQEKRIDIIPVLLSYGADVFAADNTGTTPFNWALREKGDVLAAIITPETVYQNDAAGNTILHAAINGRADPETINMILDKRAMINAGNKGGDTALHIAVRTNQKENGEVLISRGADIFAANFAGESSLYLALTSSGGIREWLFNDKTAKATDGLGNSVLHYAAQWKLDSFIPFIIQKGTSVDAANVTGETPLFWSVKYDSPSTVRVLLNNRANIDARDILGNSALHAAVRWNAKNSANALIDSGININTHSLSGNTPLHEAVRLGATEMEILLISRGANLEIRNADGNTPFMEAVMTGNSMSMNRLASAGADPMTRNARGDTPLHIAVSIERYDIINTLLVLGSSIHARNTRSRTPFQTGLGISEQMVSSLLTIDQINTSDNYGNSPLHIALQEEAPASIISLIISCGGRLTAVDSNGRTPLRLAVDSGNWQSAKVLADAGADPFAAAVDGKNAAEIAIAKGRDAIDALFSGRAVSARDNSGNNILHYAARLGTPQLISRLMELGADKNTRNIASERPVDIALRWNLTENAALLQN